MYRLRVRCLALAVLVAGCGDNHGACDYAETDDTGNATAAESSGLVVGSGAQNVCGTVDSGHFDLATSTIDVDRFRVTTSTDGQVLVRIAGDPTAAILSRLAVSIFDTAPSPRLLADVALAGDHGAQLVELPAGDYDLAVRATAPGDLSGAIAYRVELVPAPPCAQATGPAYQEAAGNNDAIAIDLAKVPGVAMMDGVAEATGLVATANNTLHIAGTATADDHPDSYADRDSYAIRTDASANELIVRLDWADAAADLDFYLFDARTLATVAAGDLGAAGAQELRAFPVQPDTSYVLWVGSYKGTHAPATYDVTVCGTHFFH